MMKQKLELLAPAGSFQALKAAVISGADAVYLGGGKFNARVNAGNFTEDELLQAIDYAHERGVKVYITINTLLKNEELQEALQFTAFAHQQGADAVIVQDLGFLNLLKRALPELEIHASTQMTLTSSRSVHALEELGVKRVVLSRELSLNEIQSISEKCKAELEIFVHGALCVSYSGQCLMSSFIGGRSGNRGVCAQPCRLPWSISKDGSDYGKDAYLISPRDLMAIELLPQLKMAGVTSLKLEGRMKSPEYVAIVTSIYRKYLDLSYNTDHQSYKVEESDRERLLQAFNRGGFTQNYLRGDRDFRKLVYTRHPKNQGILVGIVQDLKPLYMKVNLEKPLHMGDGIEIMDIDSGPCSMIVTDILLNGAHVRFAEAGTSPWVGDVKALIKAGSQVYKTLSKPLFEEARNTYERNGKALVALSMQFILRIGEKAILKVTDHEGSNVNVSSEIAAEKALNKPLSKERIHDQLQKTGDSPYGLNHLEVISDGESTIPISVLNSMRREALGEISRLRIGRHKKAGNAVTVQKRISDNIPVSDLSLSVCFYEAPDTLIGLDELVKRVYLPVTSRDVLNELRQQYSGELFLWTPPILLDKELIRIHEALNRVTELFDGLTYGSLGVLKTFKEAFPNKSLCAEPAMNLFNDEALALQKSLGAQNCVLSPELRLSEVKDMESMGLNLEALVYGRVPLMTMEHCPSAAETGCSGLCGECAGRSGYLKDRKGEIFPFVRDPILKRTQIFNAFPIFMDDTTAVKDTPLQLIRLSFTSETSETYMAIVRYYAAKLKGNHEYAPQDLSFIQSLKERGFTKGHWFRGV